MASKTKSCPPAISLSLHIFLFQTCSSCCGCKTNSPRTQRCKAMVCKLMDSGGLGIQTRAQQDLLVFALWCLGAQLDLKAGAAPICSLIHSLLTNLLMQMIGCSFCSCLHGFSLCGLSALAGLGFLRARWLDSTVKRDGGRERSEEDRKSVV